MAIDPQIPVLEARIADLEGEVRRWKSSRIYYQTIVYDICNLIDKSRGVPIKRRVVCGTNKEPSREVQDAVETVFDENRRLHKWVNDLQSGMFINCVYCGHRYGPQDETPVAMSEVLKQHVEQCPEHPMSKLKAENERLREAVTRIKEATDIDLEYADCGATVSGAIATAWGEAEAALEDAEEGGEG